MNAPLRGRVALITGTSRERGIGAAICRALAGAGADICFTHWQSYDRDRPWGAEEAFPRQLQVELRGSGVRCEQFEADLRQPTAAHEVMNEVYARLGSLAILVNNAAYSVGTRFDELDASVLDAHYAVNVRAMALLSAEFARRFAGDSGGRIMNLTSGQFLGPMPDELAYAATKGAVDAFTISLAAALAPRGITVNALNPGPTDTGWITDELKRDLLSRFPSHQLGQPEDVARLVAFLASDAAASITGQVIHAEGGFRR